MTFGTSYLMYSHVRSANGCCWTSSFKCAGSVTSYESFFCRWHHDGRPQKLRLHSRDRFSAEEKHLLQCKLCTCRACIFYMYVVDCSILLCAYDYTFVAQPHLLISAVSQSDHIVDIRCSNLYVDGDPKLTTFDYVMDMTLPSENNPVMDPAMRRQSAQLT